MRTPEQIIGQDRLEQLTFEGYAVVPIKITAGIACALEMCAPVQTPEVLARLIDDYEPVWSHVLAASNA